MYRGGGTSLDFHHFLPLRSRNATLASNTIHTWITLFESLTTWSKKDWGSYSFQAWKNIYLQFRIRKMAPLTVPFSDECWIRALRSLLWWRQEHAAWTAVYERTWGKGALSDGLSENTSIRKVIVKFWCVWRFACFPSRSSFQMTPQFVGDAWGLCKVYLHCRRIRTHLRSQG